MKLTLVYLSLEAETMAAGGMPTSAPLVSTALRGHSSSDRWNSAEIAELDTTPPARPVVDDLDWETPLPDPGHFNFSDLETVEIADSQGSGWGHWGGSCNMPVPYKQS